jgi:hypothetical protein
MVGYRRPQNLKELLVKASIPYKTGDDLNRPKGMATLRPGAEDGAPRTNFTSWEASQRQSGKTMDPPVEDPCTTGS